MQGRPGPSYAGPLALAKLEILQRTLCFSVGYRTDIPRPQKYNFAAENLPQRETSCAPFTCRPSSFGFLAWRYQ
jgi:hypothetical protein